MDKEIIQGTLIKGKMCHNCKMLEDWLEERNMCVSEEIYAELHMDLCREKNISTVPSLIMKDTGHILRGIDEIKEYLTGVCNG